MGQRKRKAVFTVEPDQLEKISEIVRSGKYKSTSEFLPEAIDEKLRRLHRERLTEQVERY
jgi:Arc/MetJ-type ribon-helix-helix transcriptional regulator